MKVTTYINSIHELSLAHDNGIDEIILGHKDFSRLGTLDDDGFERLAKESNLLGIKPVFEWDILMTDDVFNKVIKKLNNLDLKNIEIFRVQDPGALNYVFENFSNTIQLILENGNHNFVGLRQWKDFLGSRLDRLVLSIEIPKDKLTEYITKLDCPIEILGLGRILLFYSPRNLLSPLVSDKRDFIYAEGESEESPHKGFPIIENKHGTFMFHIKNIFLLENLIELNQMKLSHLRIDLRDTDFLQLSHICNLVKDYSIEASKKFKETYAKDVIIRTCCGIKSAL